MFNDTLRRGHFVGPPLIATDGFQYYARVVRQLFGSACVYGQVIKTRQKNRVSKVERRALIGSALRLERALEESEDSAQLNTSYIERLNLTLRRSLAPLARRSPSHAHCQKRLRAHLELARFYYNFIRQNSALRFGNEVRTPAMVAGLSKRVLSFRDVFAPVMINS